MKYNENKYYYDGYAAHTNGWPVDSSPLIAGTHSSLSWNHGWRDAENDSRKRSALNETDNANQQFESLATKQDEGWNGEGMPPVGSIVELMDDSQSSAWEQVTIKFYGDAFAVWGANGREESNSLCHVRVRPIRTEADRKREEAINEIASLIGRGTFCDDAAGIYDAIAAGKIPHIKLEPDYE